MLLVVTKYYSCDSLSFRGPEPQKIAEVSQQTLTDFVQALVNSCLASVRERLQKEVWLEWYSYVGLVIFL